MRSPVNTQMRAYERTPWADHMGALRWAQGDHVMISGPTGSGKTTMMAQLVEKRSHAVVFVTKMQDPTFVSEFKTWERITEWPKGGPRGYQKRLLLWPKPYRDIRDTISNQRDVFRHALNEILTQGNRCVVIDESLMMNDPKLVGLGTEIGMAHYYGRSAGVSMVSLTQRPSWIPKVIYSSVSHAYLAATKDATDAKRLSDMGGIDAKEVGHNLLHLPTRQDYVYVNPLGDAEPTVINTRK